MSVNSHAKMSISDRNLKETKRPTKSSVSLQVFPSNASHTTTQSSPMESSSTSTTEAPHAQSTTTATETLANSSSKSDPEDRKNIDNGNDTRFVEKGAGSIDINKKCLEECCDLQTETQFCSGWLDLCRAIERANKPKGPLKRKGKAYRS